MQIIKTLDTIPEDIYSILEGKSLYDGSIVDRFGDNLKEVLHKRLKQEDTKPYLRMSSIGKPLRQLWYDLNGFDGEKIEGKTLVKFLYGELCEALVISLAQASGHKAERFQEEVEVDGVPGRIDLTLDGFLVDVKSCSPRSFLKFKDATLFDNDPFGYVGQLCGYAEALKLPAAWVAIEKVSGEICVLHLPQDKVDAWNVRNKITTIRSAVAQPNEPERCYTDEPDGKSGNRKIGPGCSYCSHKIRCWRDANNGQGLKVYYYANGPRWLTSVMREPKVKADWDFEPVQQQ